MEWTVLRPTRLIVLAGWVSWGMCGLCMAGQFGPRVSTTQRPATTTSKQAAKLPAGIAADGSQNTEIDSTDCPPKPCGACLRGGKANAHLADILQRMHHRVEPPAVYHHSNFHPVPVRPPLAPGWMVPGDAQQIRAARTNWSQQSVPRVPAQRIQITPPPMPDQGPRTTPSARGKDEVFARDSLSPGESDGQGSWIFSSPELGRREPATVEARRPEHATPAVRR